MGSSAYASKNNFILFEKQICTQKSKTEDDNLRQFYFESRDLSLSKMPRLIGTELQYLQVFYLFHFGFLGPFLGHYLSRRFWSETKNDYN